MRLIDADRMKMVIEKNFGHGTVEPIYQLIDSAPTIEPKQGEWINVGTYEECKDCGEVKRFPHWNFCPHCGARMKGADDEVD